MAMSTRVNFDAEDIAIFSTLGFLFGEDIFILQKIPGCKQSTSLYHAATISGSDLYIGGGGESDGYPKNLLSPFGLRNFFDLENFPKSFWTWAFFRLTTDQETCAGLYGHCGISAFPGKT